MPPTTTATATTTATLSIAEVERLNETFKGISMDAAGEHTIVRRRFITPGTTQPRSRYSDCCRCCGSTERLNSFPIKIQTKTSETVIYSVALRPSARSPMINPGGWLVGWRSTGAKCIPYLLPIHLFTTQQSSMASVEFISEFEAQQIFCCCCWVMPKSVCRF